MVSRKEGVIYFLLCLAVTFLQAASNILQHYGKSLLISSLLYFVFGLIVQKKFPGVKTWQLYASTIPYFLIILSTRFYQADIPNIIGIFSGLGLAILVFRSHQAPLFKVMLTAFWLAGILYFAFWRIPHREISKSSFAINKQLPAFTLTDSTAKPVSTRQWNGKVVLIDMWYTKCGACIKQMRVTQKIRDHFKASPNVKVCAVNCGYDSLPAIASFKSRFPFLGESYLDQDSAISKHLGIDGFPRTFIIDKKGVLRLHIEGFAEEWEDEYEAKVISTIEQLAKE